MKNVQPKLVESKVLIALRLIDLVYAVTVWQAIRARWLSMSVLKDLSLSAPFHAEIVLMIAIGLFVFTVFLIFYYEQNKKWAINLMLLFNVVIVIVCTYNVSVFSSMLQRGQIIEAWILAEILVVIGSLFVIWKAYRRK